MKARYTPYRQHGCAQDASVSTVASTNNLRLRKAPISPIYRQHSVAQDVWASEHLAAPYRQHGVAQDAWASEHLAAGVQAATKTATGVSPCYSVKLPRLTDTTGKSTDVDRLPHEVGVASAVSTDVRRFTMLIPHGLTPVASHVALRAMMLGG